MAWRARRVVSAWWAASAAHWMWLPWMSTNSVALSVTRPVLASTDVVVDEAPNRYVHKRDRVRRRAMVWARGVVAHWWRAAARSAVRLRRITGCQPHSRQYRRAVMRLASRPDRRSRCTPARDRGEVAAAARRR